MLSRILNILLNTFCHGDISDISLQNGVMSQHVINSSFPACAVHKNILFLLFFLANVGTKNIKAGCFAVWRWLLGWARCRQLNKLNNFLNLIQNVWKVNSFPPRHRPLLLAWHKYKPRLFYSSQISNLGILPQAIGIKME